MKEFEYVIKDELGLHARPAGLLVKEAKKFNSEILITKGEKEVSAAKLIGVMGLCVKQNDTIKIKISGEDEEEAFLCIKAFFESGL